MVNLISDMMTSRESRFNIDLDELRRKGLTNLVDHTILAPQKGRK